MKLYNFGKMFINSLEIGSPPDVVELAISPSSLLDYLEKWAVFLDYKRCILLLDDAAHAFSSNEQEQFFEIFRELRSRVVSSKAAVYPGITSYSPFFHVGHEAEMLEAWYQPEDPEYLSTMRNIVHVRLPEHLSSQFGGKEEIIDYIALAAFGLPRGFLTMLSEILGIDESTPRQPTRRDANIAIENHAVSVRQIFE